MPNMDGFQFVAALGARGTLAGLTVVAVTGSAPEPAILTRLKAAGFTSHLTKPLDYDAMARVLDELLPTKPRTGRRRDSPKKG
jgi:CheY-like chemotaxis protein